MENCVPNKAKQKASSAFLWKLTLCVLFSPLAGYLNQAWAVGDYKPLESPVSLTSTASSPDSESDPFSPRIFASDLDAKTVAACQHVKQSFPVRPGSAFKLFSNIRRATQMHPPKKSCGGEGDVLTEIEQENIDPFLKLAANFKTRDGMTSFYQDIRNSLGLHGTTQYHLSPKGLDLQLDALLPTYTERRIRVPVSFLHRNKVQFVT